MVAAVASITAADVTLTLGPDTVESYTGRVYLTATQRRGAPRTISWTQPNPVFYIDVEDWRPDTPLVFGPDTPGHSIKRLGDFPSGEWTLQAVIRTSNRSASSLSGEGTVYSGTQRIVNRPDPGVPNAELLLDRVEPSPVLFPAGYGLEFFQVDSALLSEHFSKPFQLRAVIRVPDEASTDAPVPTLYVIGGFPGSLQSSIMIPWLFGAHDEADELAIVYLEAEFTGGHSAFVDSASGGPWGTALVTELIPALEKKFPLEPRRDARFLTGHSSGGWSSLWLALEYPEVFGGTVSTAPDPVDFTRFQTVDIYAPNANLYTSHDGQRAPLMRSGARPIMWADDFVAMESVLGEGGQMRSFEWAFSPRGPDGLPVPLWDRATGVIDPEIAKHWRRFDIAHRITREWDTLEPVLKERVLIVMGTQDTFYLEGAAQSLDAMLTTRGLGDVVELVPGDHSSILTPEMAKRIMQRALLMAGRTPPTASDGSTEHTPSPP